MEILHKKIAISGKMGSGKSTISNQFVQEMGFNRVSIGDAIKKLSTLVILKKTNEIEDFLDVLTKDDGIKRMIISESQAINQSKDEKDFEKDENGNFIKNKIYRLTLQEIATFMRSVFGQTVWVQYLIESTKHISPIIVDDLRLKLEKELLENNGYVVLRLDIEKEEQIRRLEKIYGEVNEESLQHETEIDLDREKFFARKDVTNEKPSDIFMYFKKELKDKKVS